MSHFEADSSWSAGRIAILTTRWNSFITDNLLHGALKALARSGVPDDQIDIVRVPGAFELPLAAQRTLDTDRYQGLIALGCVIRGGTPHFDYVCSGCMDGLMQVQMECSVPVAFGVLTVDDVDQAIARSSDDTNNKGAEAALTVLEMINLMDGIE